MNTITSYLFTTELNKYKLTTKNAKEREMWYNYFMIKFSRLFASFVVCLNKLAAPIPVFLYQNS